MLIKQEVVHKRLLKFKKFVKKAKNETMDRYLKLRREHQELSVQCWELSRFWRNITSFYLISYVSWICYFVFGMLIAREWFEFGFYFFWTLFIGGQLTFILYHLGKIAKKNQDILKQISFFEVRIKPRNMMEQIMLCMKRLSTLSQLQENRFGFNLVNYSRIDTAMFFTAFHSISVFFMLLYVQSLNIN